MITSFVAGVVVASVVWSIAFSQFAKEMKK